ncbi:MAG: sigma-70 family RNA polymerase sigma factor [Halioglobus sp.]
MARVWNRLKSDHSLMLAYQRGDMDAFESLYHRHKDALFAHLFRSCSRHAIVEEIAQETWTAVIQAAGRYRPEAKFRTWLYQIAHHRMVDFWRRPDNQHSNLENVPEEIAPQDQAEQTDGIEKQVMNALAQLPLEQRTIVLLREQGFSYQELSDIVGVGRETVKSRLRYAREQLSTQLGRVQEPGAETVLGGQP